MTGITRRDAVIGTAATVAAATVATVAAADQPHMDAALDHLRKARAELEQASHNKGGHRQKAIDLIQQAIDQVKLGKEAAA